MLDIPYIPYNVFAEILVGTFFFIGFVLFVGGTIAGSIGMKRKWGPINDFKATLTALVGSAFLTGGVGMYSVYWTLTTFRPLGSYPTGTYPMWAADRAAPMCVGCLVGIGMTALIFSACISDARRCMEQSRSEARKEAALDPPAEQDLAPTAPKEEDTSLPFSPEDVIRKAQAATRDGGKSPESRAALRDLEEAAKVQKRTTAAVKETLGSQTETNESYVSFKEKNQSHAERVYKVVHPDPPPAPVEIPRPAPVEVPERPVAATGPGPSEPGLCRKVADAILGRAVSTPHYHSEEAFEKFFHTVFAETNASLGTFRKRADRTETLKIAIDKMQKLKDK